MLIVVKLRAGRSVQRRLGSCRRSWSRHEGGGGGGGSIGTFLDLDEERVLDAVLGGGDCRIGYGEIELVYRVGNVLQQSVAVMVRPLRSGNRDGSCFGGVNHQAAVLGLHGVCRDGWAMCGRSPVTKDYC